LTFWLLTPSDIGLASNLITGSDVCCGLTPLLQHRFAQPFGIAFARFRKLDYLLRDDIVANVATMNKAKGYYCHLKGKTHEPHRLWVESIAI
jgi:hypothetical protein